MTKNEATFYLTQHDYLNDLSEIDGQLLRLKKICEKWDKENFIYDLPEFFKEYRESFSIYIGLFCKQRDKLSQWRAYCPQGGISIGINREAIQDSDVFINLCSYYDEEIFEDLKQAEQEYLKERSRYPADAETLPFAIISPLLRSLLTIKNPHFHEEEIRLIKVISQADENIRFRISDNKIIPYIEYKLPVESVQEIFIEPSLEHNKTKFMRDIKRFCKQKGITPDISCSDIPLRVAY